MKRIIFLILLIFLIKGGYCASSSITGQDLKFGAVPLSMGEVYTGFDGDVNSVTWNPASLASIKAFQFTANYSQPFGLSFLKQTYIGTAFPFLFGTHAFTFSRVEASYNGFYGLDALDYNEDYLYYTFARPILRNIYFGTNLKLIKISSGMSKSQVDANGYGVDLGVLIKLSNTQIGFTIQDLLSDYSWGSGLKESMPYKYRAGIMHHLFDRSVSVGFDIVGDEDESIKSMNFGFEWWLFTSRFLRNQSKNKAPYFKDVQAEFIPVEHGLALRGGIIKEMFGNDDFRYSLGIGYKFGVAKFDYAFLMDNDALGNTHLFSFSMDFAKNKEKALNSRETRREIPKLNKEEKGEEITREIPVVKKEQVVLVPKFNVEGSKSLVWLEKGSAEVLASYLERNDLFKVVKDYAQNQENFTNIKADIMLKGNIKELDGGKIIVTVEMISKEGIQYLRQSGSVDDIFNIMENLALKIK